jgi:hypothetical protein
MNNLLEGFRLKRKTAIIEIIFVVILFSILYWKQVIRISDFRFYMIGVILIVLFNYSKKMAHRRRLTNWDKIRINGKTRFILYDYVFIRGGIVSTLLILILSLKVEIGLLIIFAVLPLFGVMAFAGNEEWKKCEEQFAISALKSVAEKFKVMRN